MTIISQKRIAEFLATVTLRRIMRTLKTVFAVALIPEKLVRDKVISVDYGREYAKRIRTADQGRNRRHLVAKILHAEIVPVTRVELLAKVVIVRKFNMLYGTVAHHQRIVIEKDLRPYHKQHQQR